MTITTKEKKGTLYEADRIWILIAEESAEDEPDVPAVTEYLVEESAHYLSEQIKMPDDEVSFNHI